MTLANQELQVVRGYELITTPAMASVLERVLDEQKRAETKHGRANWGRHEFYAVMLEEVEEAWNDIKADARWSQLEKEIVEIASVCLRYLEAGNRYGWHLDEAQAAAALEYARVREAELWARRVADRGGRRIP